MATDVQPGAPGGALAEKPKVFGLFSMILFSVSAILVADTVGSSAAMGVQGGGTVVSLFIGWWLHWQSSRGRGGGAPVTVNDVQG